MRLETKKIIAREFLLLLAAIAIGAMFLLATIFYNTYYIHKVQKLDRVIADSTQIADSLSKQYDQKNKNQNWLFSKESDEYDVSNAEYNTKDKLWQRLSYLASVDSIKCRWQYQ